MSYLLTGRQVTLTGRAGGGLEYIGAAGVGGSTPCSLQQLFPLIGWRPAAPRELCQPRHRCHQRHNLPHTTITLYSFNLMPSCYIKWVSVCALAGQHKRQSLSWSDMCKGFRVQSSKFLRICVSTQWAKHDPKRQKVQCPVKSALFTSTRKCKKHHHSDFHVENYVRKL